MVQYGFCGGAAKPANTFYLFWQWAWPGGCRILCTPAPGAAGRTSLVLRDTRQPAPAGAKVAAGAAAACGDSSCAACSVPPACPSPRGCRLVPGSLQGAGTARTAFPPLWGWVWGHTALSLPCRPPQAVRAQTSSLSPLSSRGRARPHPARFLCPYPCSATLLHGQIPAQTCSSIGWGISDCGPKPGCGKGGGARLRLAGGRLSTRGVGGGRGQSLGNSQTMAPQGEQGCWRARMPIPVLARELSRGYTLEQWPRQGLPAWLSSARPALLPSTWFNMRESKCTIQNLKTGLWFAPHPPCIPRRR